jgi:hypothetical protein
MPIVLLLATDVSRIKTTGSHFHCFKEEPCENYHRLNPVTFRLQWDWWKTLLFFEINLIEIENIIL